MKTIISNAIKKISGSMLFGGYLYSFIRFHGIKTLLVLIATGLLVVVCRGRVAGNK